MKEKKIKYTPHGFSYLDVTIFDCLNWGGMGICNNCNKIYRDLKLIYVLTDTYCEKCFNDWVIRCNNYSKEDIKYDLNVQKNNDIVWYKYHGVL